MKKNLLKSIILFILVSLFFSSSNVFADSFDVEDISHTNAYLNPDYIKYMNLTEEERNTLAVIPEQYIVNYQPVNNNELNIPKNNAFYDDMVSGIYPNSYDLRNTNEITPLKNQLSLGLCWAFASISSIETNLLKLGVVDYNNPVIFAERQMDYISAKPVDNDTFIGESNVRVINEGVNPYTINRQLGSGGNFNYTSLYFSSGITPVRSTGVWSSYYTNSPTRTLKEVIDNKNTEYYVTDYVDFPYIHMLNASSSDRNKWIEQIKNHIVNYGSVFEISLAPNYGTNDNSGSCSIYDSNKSAYLINDNNDCGISYPYGLHAMSIIGWDDNYTLSYCDRGDNSLASISESNCIASGYKYITVNGAWILKNSWGGTISYPYLAYDSYIYSTNGVVATSAKDWTNNYDEIDNYESNFTNGESIITYKKSKTITEQLKRIEFKHTTQNKNYKVYISPNNDNNYYLLQTGTTTFPGMVSVPVTSDINLANDSFSIKVFLQDGTRATGIYAFTNDVNIQANYYAESNIQLKTDEQNSTNYYYEINTISRNIDTGEILYYETYNSKGQKVSSYFPDAGAYVINDSAYTTIDIPQYIPVDTYEIRTIYNGTVIETNSIKLGIGSSGDGSLANPYMITSADDLAGINSLDFYLDKNYKLNNNIDMKSSFTVEGKNYNDGKLWDSIGNEDSPFTGTFDGNGFSISNLMIIRPTTNYLGLFGYIKNSTIKNLLIMSAEINVGRYSAVIVGNANNSTIDQVSVFGNVNSNGAISGIVGYLDAGSTVSNSFYNGNITGLNIDSNSFINGVRSGDSTIDDSYFVGHICNKSSIDGPCIQTLASGIVYLQDNIIHFDKKTLYELKLPSTYSTFNFSTIWEMKNIGSLPTLKKVPYLYIASFDADDMVVYKDQSKSIIKNMIPITPTQNKINYVSHDEAIASVSLDGVVTGKEYGNTTILISSNDGSHVMQTINVLVTDEYTVSFYDETGIKIIDKTVLRGETAIYDGTIPTKPETNGITYEFDKWVTEPGGEIEADLTNITSDKNVYASFKASNTFLVTFKNYNGTTLKSEYVISGEDATPPEVPNRIGYEFEKWDKSYQNILSDIIITAEYKIKQYTMSFNTNGGSSINSIVQDYDSNVASPANPTRQYYSFAGWYSDEALLSQYVFLKMPAKNITLYAKWLSNDFNVFFNNYDIKENNVYIPSQTTLSVFKSNSIFDKGSMTSNCNNVLGTNCNILIKNLDVEHNYIIIVKGDLTGDGSINSADLLKIRQHLLQSISLSGSFLLSADINQDVLINSADLLKIRQHLLGTALIS